MLSLILIKKIFSLFLVMLMGYLVVKTGKLKASDSKILSTLAAYVIFPCIIISAFNMDYTPEILKGVYVSLIGCVILCFGQIIPMALLKKPLKLQPTEHASVIYPNTGNLIIPLVSYILGQEYIIYCSVYMSFQMLLMWSHGKAILCGEKGLDLKKIFSNINMIAIILGTVMFAFGIHFPEPVQDAIDSVGSMTGPMVMLITGMLIGGMDMQKFKSYKRLPFVVSIRMVFLPLFLIALFKLSGIENISAEGEALMLIAVLSASAPTASTITQLAQLFDADADYANIINISTTLLCIVTMPLMFLIYQAL